MTNRLRGLWRYGLNAFRLEVQERGCGRYIDPAWQLFRDDVHFANSGEDRPMARKRKTPGDGNERNIGLAFGNMLSIFARNRVTPEKAWNFLKSSGIYDDIYFMMQRRAHAEFRSFSEEEVYDAVVKGMRKRMLLGKAA